MDVNYFLKERTQFVRYLYDTAASPFEEIKRKIEAGEAPYEPPQEENGEPPFLIEWSNAEQGLQLLGSACLSLLSESIKICFKTWESELHLNCQTNFKKEFKKGFFQGYRSCFEILLKSELADCPADLGIVEQVILARNSAQHAKHIAKIGADHSNDDLRRFPTPIFLSEFERKSLEIWPDTVVDGFPPKP